LPFPERCIQNAVFIRSGGLVEDENASQIATDLHETLAQMNESGFATFDSQEGHDTPDTERAYVTGFVPAGIARAFIERFNCSTDFVACIHLPCDVSPSSPFTYGGGIPATRERFGGPSCTRLPFYGYTQSHYMSLKKINGIESGEDIVIIECFDPVWGRRTTGTYGLFPAVLQFLKELLPV